MSVDAKPDIDIRAIRPGDEGAIAGLLDGLDPESRYLRWFTGGVDILSAGDWAAHPERCSGTGLLAFSGDEPIGHAVLIPTRGGRGEVAFEVAADWRHHGVATALLVRLMDTAAGSGLHEIYADVLSENADMLAVMREYGPRSESRDGGVLTIALPVPIAQDPSSRPLSRA